MDLYSTGENFSHSLIEIRNFDLKKYFDTKWKKVLKKQNLNDQDLANFCEQILLNSDDRTKRISILRYLENLFRKNGMPCKMYYFGSTINGIGFYNSDIDIYVQLLSRNNQPVRDGFSRNNLRKIKSIICQTSLNRFYDSELIWAKCPIVKLTVPKHTAKKSQMKIIDFDINLSHPLGVFNSIVINFLVSFEPSIQRLCIILKHWAKLNDLIELQALKSYTLTFMIIFFLQNCDPQYILSLDSILEYSHDFREFVRPDYENEFFKKCRGLIRSSNKIPSTFDLLHQFFTFYYNFDFINFIISPRLGFPIRKDHFHQIMISPEQSEFRITPYVCVEDPFELDRNISSAVSLPKFDQFVRLCTFYALKPADYFKKGNNFVQFASSPYNYMKKHQTLPKITQHNICPCVCYTQRYFRAEDLRKYRNAKRIKFPHKSEREQMYEFIYDFAKTIMQNITDALPASLLEEKYKDRYKVIQHNMFPDCFNNQSSRSSEDETFMRKAIIASIKVKIPNQTPIGVKRNKKQKTDNNIQSNQRFWDSDNGNIDNIFKSNAEIKPLPIALEEMLEAESEENNSVVNATLECRFISEKNYFLSFEYDQFVPKWFPSLVNRSAKLFCTCHPKRKNDTDCDTEA